MTGTWISGLHMGVKTHGGTLATGCTLLTG